MTIEGKRTLPYEVVSHPKRNKTTSSQSTFSDLPTEVYEKISSYLGNFYGSRHFVQITKSVRFALEEYRETLTQVKLTDPRIQTLLPLMRYSALTDAVFIRMQRITNYSLLPLSIKFLLISTPTPSSLLGLSRLDQLQELRISSHNTEIKTSLLASMHNLKVLIVDEMHFTQNAPIRKRLKHFGLIRSSISAPLNFRNQENLEVLHLVENRHLLAPGVSMHLEDPLSSIPFPEKLKRLCLTKVNVSRPDVFNRFQNLSSVNLIQCIIPEVNGMHFVRALSNLIHLTLENNYAILPHPDGDFTKNPAQIDFRDLSNKQQLSRLRISRNTLTHTSSFTETRSLRTLFLPFTNLQNLEFCHSLKQLTVLDIRHTAVSSLTPLENTKKLQMLFLSNTPVEDLSPLSHTKDLKVLSMGDTDISSLEPLKSHQYIEKISIRRTPIADLSVLKEWTQLQFLELSNNSPAQPQIEEIQRNNPDLDVYFTSDAEEDPAAD